MRKIIRILTAASLLLIFISLGQTIAFASGLPALPTVKVDGKNYDIITDSDNIFNGDNTLEINLSNAGGEVKFDGNDITGKSIVVYGDGTLTLSNITLNGGNDHSLVIVPSPEGTPTVNIGDNVTLESEAVGIYIGKNGQDTNQLSLPSDADYYRDSQEDQPFELNLEGDNINITAVRQGIYTDLQGSSYNSSTPNEINITGECSITINCESDFIRYAGIYALLTDVNVDGGSVDVTVDATKTSFMVLGICVEGGNYTQDGGSVEINMEGSYALGISIKNGSYSQNGGSVGITVNAVGNEGSIGLGINVEKGNYTQDGGSVDVTVNAAEEGNTIGYGIKVFNGNYTQDGGSVEIDVEGYSFFGIAIENGSYSQDGGSVDVTVNSTGGKNSNCFGILVHYGYYTQEDGSVVVDVKGSDAAYGIYVFNNDSPSDQISRNYTQDGGSVEIEVKGNKEVYGIVVFEGSFIQKNGAEISIEASYLNNDNILVMGIHQISLEPDDEFFIGGPLEIKTDSFFPLAVRSDAEIDIADGYIVEEGGRVTCIKDIEYDSAFYVFADFENTEYNASELTEEDIPSSHVKIVKEKTEEPKKPTHSHGLEQISGGSYGGGEETAEQPVFIDIIGHWAEDDIMDVYEDGYMDGVADNMFFPDSPAARLTFTDSLYRMAGSPEVSGVSPFVDCSEAAVIWAAENGIVSGFGDGVFRPYDSITREQFAVVVYNYMKYLGKDVSNIEGMGIYNFTDYGDISEWAITAVRYCINAGILSGNTDMTFNPKGAMTRAELAAIINRIK